MYSEEHKLYLKKIKTRNILVRLCQVTIIVFFIILWKFLADYKLINTFISSSPKLILNTIISLYNEGNLFKHIWITIYETIISFSLGTIIGTIIATILWWNNFLSKVLDPYLTILNSLPKVALGPIIIIWAGAGMNSIILMALLISTIITIINVYQGFIETDPIKIRLLDYSLMYKLILDYIAFTKRPIRLLSLFLKHDVLGSCRSRIRRFSIP